RERLHAAGAAGDPRRLERRAADGRGAHAAPRPVRRRDRRRAAARHAALPGLPDGALLGARVRLRRGPRAVRVALRLLALPPRPGRRALPRRAPHRRRERHARPRDARAQDGRAPAGRHRQRPGRAPGAAVGGPLGGPRPGQAARPPAARRRRPAHLRDVAARDAAGRPGLGRRGSPSPASLPGARQRPVTARRRLVRRRGAPSYPARLTDLRVLAYNLIMLVSRAHTLAGRPPATAPATRYLALQEGRIAYDSVGEGPLVVMLPGLGDLRQEYRFLAPLIAEAGYRAVTADVRGHGESSVGWPRYDAASVGQDLLALIDHLGGPAFVIGNSFAAASAVWAATQRPSAVAGLALLGPFVRPAPLNPAVTLALRLM